MVKTPSKLYKYCYFDPEGNFLKGLKANTIFFSDPKKFNDPFDSNPNLIRIIIGEGPETTQAINRLFKDAPTDIQEEAKLYSEDQHRSMIIMSYKKTMNNLYSKIGVSSFSENYDNNVMWHYYAKEHTRFVLEFDANSDFFKRKFAVNYTKDFPLIIGNELGMEGESISLANKVFLNKSPEWAHETEWRLLGDGVGKSISYIPNTLLGIYLGKDCSDQNELLIRSNLNNDSLSYVKLMKMKIKDFSFKLEPIELNNL